MVATGIARRAAAARKGALLASAAAGDAPPAARVKITAHVTARPAGGPGAARASASEDSLSEDDAAPGPRDQGARVA
jgi:hypothetical protein